MLQVVLGEECVQRRRGAMEMLEQFRARHAGHAGLQTLLQAHGQVRIAGMGTGQAQSIIQTKLVSDGIYTHPTITVTPVTGQRFVIVGGEVRAPGRIIYTPDLTLMAAIAAAGGVGDFHGDQVRLKRGGKLQVFSYKRLDRNPAEDPKLLPGDQIEVKKSIL